MADVFGRTDQVLRGGLSSDSMFISWPQLSEQGLDMLIMNLGIDYRQPIRRIFELGPGVVPAVFGAGNASFCDGPEASDVCAFRTQPTWYIIGRPEGRLQLQQIIGPNPLTCEFYQVYGSACGGNVMQVSGRAGCKAADSTAKKITWRMTGVVLDGLSAAVNSQESVIQSSPSAMFAGLKILLNDLDCTLANGGSTSTLTSGGFGVSP